jgi:hypothetical protein
MKNLQTFEQFINEAEDPKKLVGKKAKNYGGEKGTIIAAALVKDFKNLAKYDNSGWMDAGEIKNMGLAPSDILVAFKDNRGDVEVYTFGDDGVEVMESESTEINESDNFVYIQDSKFKSDDDVIKSFTSNAPKAWEKFISDKIGAKVKASASTGRGNSVSITGEVSKSDFGIFKYAFDKISFDSFGGGSISSQRVNNAVYEFHPFIPFRIHVSWSLLEGGSNGANVELSGNDKYNNTVWYDVLNGAFLDQAEAKRVGNKIWKNY